MFSGGKMKSRISPESIISPEWMYFIVAIIVILLINR
jgi:hypothetical protein